MFKYLDGDFTATTGYSMGLLSWGFGKGKCMEIKGQIAQLEILATDSKSIDFKCVFRDSRTLIAKCDFKTFQKFNKYAEGHSLSDEQMSFIQEDMSNKKSSNQEQIVSIRQSSSDNAENKNNISKLKKVPINIDLAMNAPLITCNEIKRANHQDTRILIKYLSYFDRYRDGHSISVQSLGDESAVNDLGYLNDVLLLMEGKGWIAEKSPIDLMTSLYSQDELKVFLKCHNLKIGGNKREAAARLLENVPFSNFKLKYKYKLYELTALGRQAVQEREKDYINASLKAVNFIKQGNYHDAKIPFHNYDSKWGFLRFDGKACTIFAGYSIPSKRFNFILDNRMQNLKNSKEYIVDLKAFLVVSLMRKHRDSYVLADEFRKINPEKINCPDIISLYKKDRHAEIADGLDAADFDRMIQAMEINIKNDSECVLEYYIAKILYLSKA